MKSFFEDIIRERKKNARNSEAVDGFWKLRESERDLRQSDRNAGADTDDERESNSDLFKGFREAHPKTPRVSVTYKSAKRSMTASRSDTSYGKDESSGRRFTAASKKDENIPWEDKQFLASPPSSSPPPPVTRASITIDEEDEHQMSNYPEVKDSYFIRKSTEWDIIGFLDESKEGSFEQKLDSYIKSLKTIANTEQGKRQEKAQLLIDNYKDSGIDRQRAKEWKKRYRTASGPTVNFHNSKVIGMGIGTLNVERISGDVNKEYDDIGLGKRPRGTIHGDESDSDESACESAKKRLAREFRKTQQKGMRVSEIKENDKLQTSASESDVESGSEYNLQDIFVSENMDENEPTFILKLRKVMDIFKKSTNPVDKALAQLGILRLSSRQKIYEPSTMRAEAMRALSEQEKAKLKTFTETPAVMGVPVFEGNTLNDRWRNLSSFTPSTTVERTTLRLHELFLTGLEGNEALTKA